MKPHYLIGTMAAIAALSACQGTGSKSVTVSNDAAIALLQGINDAAQKCWSHSSEKDFKPYRVIPELDTRVGIPRILIVEAKAAQGLPKFVIEASGTPASVTTYGPLAGEAVGKRMSADIERWQNGSKACA